MVVLLTALGWFAARLDLGELSVPMHASSRVSGGETVAGNVRLAELPPYVTQAVIAIEDRRFYDHIGIDPIGLARAALANLRAGEIVQGGSTITQQLAKNVFLQPDQTFSRKVKEMILAFWLERKLTKDRILEIYLNRVYFGAGARGIAEAARTYYGTSASRLTLSQAATLAGVLTAPSALAPSDHPVLAAERAALVLGAMVEEGYISPARAADAVAHLQRDVSTSGAVPVPQPRPEGLRRSPG